MSTLSNELQQKLDEVVYIKSVKELILSDVCALYSTRGLTSKHATFDVITSYYSGGYQATLIFYPDRSVSTYWQPLYDGVRCTTLTAAMKHLWSGVQEQLGAFIATQRTSPEVMNGCTMNAVHRCEPVLVAALMSMNNGSSSFPTKASDTAQATGTPSSSPPPETPESLKH